jgi:GMP synthase (glutamine-hydrolysing)
MKVLVVQNCLIEDVGLYEDYLQNYGHEYTVVHGYKVEVFPSLLDFDALIVGGTPVSVYDADKHPFLARELEYLSGAVRLNKPCLGICGGGQLLAKVLGAQVKRNPVMEIGGYRVKLTSAGKGSRFFEGFPSEFPVFQLHGDTFDIPKHGEFLVEGDLCKNQAFSFKKSLAVQFHLEVDSSTAGKWADEYKDDLLQVGKTRDQVVKECRRSEKEMKRLAILFLDNFFRQTNLT